MQFEGNSIPSSVDESEPDLERDKKGLDEHQGEEDFI